MEKTKKTKKTNYNTYKHSAFRKESKRIQDCTLINLTEEQSNRRVFDKFVGNYIYRVENIGFGNYRIIDKIKIEG